MWWLVMKKIKNETKVPFNFAFRSKIMLAILVIVLVSGIGITAGISAMSEDIDIEMPKEIKDKLTNAGIREITHTGINCSDVLCNVVYFSNTCEKGKGAKSNINCIEFSDNWLPKPTYTRCDPQTNENCITIPKTNEELQLELQEQLNYHYNRLKTRIDTNTNKKEETEYEQRVEKGKGIIKEKKIKVVIK